MVEPQIGYSTRTPTPTPSTFTRNNLDFFREPSTHSNSSDGPLVPEHPSFSPGASLQVSNVANGHDFGHAPFSPRGLMQRDARKRSTSMRDRPRPDNHRSRPSNSNPIIGPSPARALNYPSPVHSAPHTPGLPLDRRPHGYSGLGASSLHHGPSGSYTPNGTFYGQYTIPSPPYVSPGHPNSFQLPQGLPLSGADIPIPPQDPYSAMLHSGQAPYRYPPGDLRNANPPYITPPHTTHYPVHPSQMNPSGSVSSNLPGPYFSSGYFSNLGYGAPPMGGQPYSFAYPFHSPTSAYGGYESSSYPHSATSPLQEDVHGTWYYTHGPAPPSPHQTEDNQRLNEDYEPQYPSLNQNPYAQSPQLADHRSQTTHRSATNKDAGERADSTSGPSPSSHNAVSPRPPSRATSATGKQVVRREYHPRAPDRSPWVMWVGNVPSDATQEELALFFSKAPNKSDSAPMTSGVVSIFLITRSNCAFVNYSTEEALTIAIQTYNGTPLRPDDPQCPMLVCKIRKSADDLTSGVGGQRGMGLHKQWVREQRKLRKLAGDAVEGVEDGRLVDEMESLTFGDVDDRGGRPRPTLSSSSESFTSTTSSLLGEHFPTRYFILKSLSESDLELSVERGLWATQKHNELVLDRAFRTATDVFLIFSVNKSGEFYGYARMAGPIRQGEGKVAWTSRSPPPGPLSPSPYLNPTLSASLGPIVAHGSVVESPESIRYPQDGTSPPYHAESFISKEKSARPAHQSAPAQLVSSDSPPLSERIPSVKYSLDHYQGRQSRPAAFHLDPDAPFRAMRGRGAASGEAFEQALNVAEREVLSGVGQATGEQQTNSAGRAGGEDLNANPSPTWGDCFKVQWIVLRKIPFHKTRHLRNAWNKDREIKVSRDGTELESSVGRRLLEEWGDLAEA